MTIVFAGGGTGGHLYPAIAIADALRERRATIAFIGASDRLEATIVPNAGYTLRTVASRPLTRRPSFELVRTVASNFKGTLQSLRILTKLRPELVIATGGYVCFPIVLAARILRAIGVVPGPIALLESNATPGLTNRLLAPLVDEVWGAFPDADRRFHGKYVRTGMPVRASLRTLPLREEAIARLGLRTELKTLVAMGGSQGARAINDALVALLERDDLPPGWQLLHLTGEREYDRVRDALRTRAGAAIDSKRVVIRPYLHDMADAYAAADLVLARAGASTLGELAATGKPAILVPYPFAAEDHQTANAQCFAAAGAAVMLSDRELETGRLHAVLAEAAAPRKLAESSGNARRLRDADPVATILARVDALTTRKNAR